MNFHGNTDRPKSRITATESNSSGRTWDFVAGPGGRSGPGIEKGPTGAGNSSLKGPFEKADSDDQAQKKPLEEGPAKRVKLQTSSKDTSNPPQDKTSQISDSHTMAKTRDEAGLSLSPAETGNKLDFQYLAKVAKAALSLSPAETGGLQYLARDTRDRVESFKKKIPDPAEKEITMYNYAAGIYNFIVGKLKKLGNSTDLSPMMPIKLGLRGGSEATDNTSLIPTDNTGSISNERRCWLNALDTLEEDFRGNAWLNRAMRLGMDLRGHNAPQTAIARVDRLVDNLGQLMNDQREDGSWQARRGTIRNDIIGITTAVAANTSNEARNDVLQFLYGLGLTQVFSL